MKIQDTKKPSSSNLDSNTTLKIAMNSKTFRMLSDTLYSDKKRAVVRELACNAYDAQRAAGNLKERKYDLFLPTPTNPIFKIRDYGTGMSDEVVMSLYLTYGESTKDTSNDDIGCFGIGSKSPFAYTDMFIVTSFFNGIKSTYSVYLDDGIPNCVKLSGEETSESNGVEVQFNVESKDIEDFKIAAKKVFKSFDILPNFNIDLNIEKEKFDIEEKDYSLRMTSGYYGNKTIVALQGNIEYPVDKSMIKELPFNYDKILLKFDIGEFDFAPSREAISYNNQTIENINKKLSKIEKMILKDMKAKISKNETIYEYNMDLIKASNSLSINFDTIKKYKMNIFKGFQIENPRDLFGNCYALTNRSFMVTPSESGTSKLTKKSFSMKNRAKSVVLSKKWEFVINDLIGKAPLRLLTEFAVENNLDNNNFIFVEEGLSSNDMLELTKLVGDVKRLSEYISYDEDVQKQKKKDAKIDKPKQEIQGMFTIESYESRSLIPLKELSKNKKYLFLPIIRKSGYSTTIEIDGKDFRTSDYSFRDLHLLIEKKHNIVFIKKALLKDKFIKENKLECMSEYLRENSLKLFKRFHQYKMIENSKSKIHEAELSRLFNHILNEDISIFKRDINLEKYFKITKLSKIADKFRNKSIASSFVYSNLIADIYENEIDHNPSSFKIFDKIPLIDVDADIYMKYPMLKYTNNYNYDDIEHLNYIKYVQSKNKKKK